jgi:pimeloyl-ACP methyl ester carboxylesterase
MPTVKVNNIDLNYVDRGEGDVLLMIHNVVANVTAYQQNIDVLSRHFRVIACDLRGHGQTTHSIRRKGRAPSIRSTISPRTSPSFSRT